MKLMRKDKLLVGGRLILSVLLLSLLIARIDYQSVIEVFAQMALGYYLLAVALFFLSILLSAYRWQMILAATGASPSLWQLTTINLIGNFFSNFLPTAVGGDLMRVTELAYQGERDHHQTISTVMLDRLIGLISLAIMATLALLVGFSTVKSMPVRLVVLGLTVGLVSGWVLFFNKPLMRRFRWLLQLPGLRRLAPTVVRLYHSLYALHRQPQLLHSSIAISLLLQIVEVLSVILIARSLGIHLSALYFFLFLPLIWLVTMIPLSLNGLGLREGAFTFFFGLVGVAAPAALAISFLVYACRLLSGLIGGLCYARATLGRQIQPAIQAE